MRTGPPVPSLKGREVDDRMVTRLDSDVIITCQNSWALSMPNVSEPCCSVTGLEILRGQWDGWMQANYVSLPI